MAATMWQVQIGKKLSKRYTIDQLMSKLQSGAISENSACSVDSGASFVSLSKLLAENAAVVSSDAVLHKSIGLRKLARADQYRLPSPESDLDAPIVATSRPLSPASKPDSLKAADTVLSRLYANAATAMAESDESTDGEDDDAELYRIPAPPVALATSSTLPREFFEPQPSPVALAAARALELDQQSHDAEQNKSKTQQRPERLKLISAESKRTVHDGNKVARPSLSVRSVKAITVTAGMGAIGILIWWFGSHRGPPTFEELTGGAVAISDFRSDAPVTVEELHARTQILGVQVGRITRALTLLDGPESTEELRDLPPQPIILRMPLLPFRQRTLSDEQQVKVEDYRARYAQLIQDKGPDGRKLDDASVTRAFSYLKYIIDAADTKEPDRVTALFELSEWVKLVYLLELGRLNAAGSDLRQKAVDEILASSNAGLSLLYSELKTGDMRFIDVFERSVAAEQSRLLLTRYWYHRAVNRTAADQWLPAVLKLVDESDHAFVQDSIAEVDRIDQ